MKRIIFTLILFAVISCEYNYETSYNELYYTVIEKATSHDPVFLYEAIRKKGAPYVFYQSETNTPQIYRTIEHIPLRDIEASNAEIITVQLIF